MKLTTRSRYGVKLLYELALQYGGESVVIRDIAVRHKLSVKYLSKLILLLKGANLVISSRGSQGGYLLARDPSRITLREIVQVMEGDCTVSGRFMNYNCESSNECPSGEIWRGLDQVIYRYLEEITLEDIIKKEVGWDGVSNYMI